MIAGAADAEAYALAWRWAVTVAAGALPTVMVLTGGVFTLSGYA